LNEIGETSGVIDSNQSGVNLRCGFCLEMTQVDLIAGRPICGNCEKPILVDRPIKVAEEDFEATVLGADVPVLVDFYADWCGPCKMVAPIMDNVAHANVGQLIVAKVDTDRAQRISGELEIRGVPTLILFRDGAEVDRSVGLEPDKIRAMVQSAIAG
jgi:thioredoxin 2